MISDGFMCFIVIGALTADCKRLQIRAVEAKSDLGFHLSVPFAGSSFEKEELSDPSYSRAYSARKLKSSEGMVARLDAFVSCIVTVMAGMVGPSLGNFSTSLLGFLIPGLVGGGMTGFGWSAKRLQKT